jgi:hypothetical protein
MNSDETLVPADALASELKEATYSGHPERKTLLPEGSVTAATITSANSATTTAAVPSPSLSGATTPIPPLTDATAAAIAAAALEAAAAAAR